MGMCEILGENKDSCTDTTKGEEAARSDTRAPRTLYLRSSSSEMSVRFMLAVRFPARSTCGSALSKGESKVHEDKRVKKGICVKPCVFVCACDGDCVSVCVCICVCIHLCVYVYLCPHSPYSFTHTHTLTHTLTHTHTHTLSLSLSLSLCPSNNSKQQQEEKEEEGGWLPCMGRCLPGAGRQFGGRCGA